MMRAPLYGTPRPNAGFRHEMLKLLAKEWTNEATLAAVGVLPDSWIAATGRRSRTAAVDGTRRTPGHDRARNPRPHWTSLYGGPPTSPPPLSPPLTPTLNSRPPPRTHTR